MFDETLRVELAPLQVKVLTVVTGSIETNIQANSPEPKLPEDSKYLAAAGYLSKSHSDQTTFRRDKPDIFAKSVIRDILHGTTGKVYRGPHSSIVRYVQPLMPMWMQVSIVLHADQFNLLTLVRIMF